MGSGASINFVGNLGRDAELKQTKSGDSVCTFSVAVSDKRTDSTAWYACSVWGARGSVLAPMLTKGKSVWISGRLVPREYKGKNDELRTSFDVRVSDLEFVGAGGGAAGGETDTSRGRGKPSAAPSPAVDDDSDSIPF